jgi:hypothetical protein
VGEVIASLDWPSATAWGVFAGGCVMAAFLGTAGHLQRAWYRWRLERRLARNPGILREQLNEHLLEIGEDRPPLDPTRLVSGSLAAGGLGAIFAWLMERGLEGWLQIGELLLGAAVFLLGLWRWLNDPPEMRREDGTITALRGFFAERTPCSASLSR